VVLRPTSESELAEAVLALTGSRSKLVHRPLPENDPMQRRPDIARARALLDWAPTVPLEEGLIKTIAYFEALLAAEWPSGTAASGLRAV